MVEVMMTHAPTAAASARPQGRRLRGTSRRPFLRRLAGSALVPVAAGAAGAPAACGGQDDGAAASGAKRALPAKVTFLVDTSAADHTRYWQLFVRWFEEQYPGTKVEAILPPGEGPYEVKVLTMLAGGTVPDLFHLNNRYVYDYHYRGLLQPLDQLLRRANLPLADVIPGVLIPYRVGNQLVGIPRDNATSAIYYNKDLCAATGVKEPDGNWTWDDYLETARKLTSPDRQRFGSTFPQIENPVPASHLSFVRSFGGDWFDAGMREVVVDRAPALRAFQFALDLRFRHGVVGRPEELQRGDQLIGQAAALTQRWTTPRKSLLNDAVPKDGQPLRFREAIVEPLLASKGVAMPPGFGDMQGFFQTEMQPVWDGKRGLSEGLAMVKRQWTQLLEEANRARR